MNDKVVMELNKLLKGEEMALEAYERLIRNTGDEKVKTQLQEIQKNHKMHSAELAERIQELGAQPDYGTGFSGVMAGIKMSMEGLDKKSSLGLLKEAYDGEDKGISMVEDMLQADMDDKSKKLVNKVLSNDHDHLRKMAHLISDYETRH